MSEERGVKRRRRSTAGDPEERAVYVISVAAELAGVHPQTLRIYERKGLLLPARTPGNTRRYSDRDIARLRTIQRLTQELGVNLAGVQMILDMEDRVDRLSRRSDQLSAELEVARERLRSELDRLGAERASTALVPASAVRRLRVEVRRGRASAAARSSAERRRGPIALGPAAG